MLNGNLVRTQQRGRKLLPKYIDDTKPQLLNMAEALIDIYRNSIGKSRETIHETFSSFLGKSKDLLIYKGLCKILEDRCHFGADDSIEPEIIRKELFLIASQAHKEGNFNRRSILDHVGLHLEIAPPHIERLLYSDLKQNQNLLEFKEISKEHLLQRYNTSLVQAILLRAVKLDIHIVDKDKLRYRQLFRAIKFYRLLYEIKGDEKNGFSLSLDGPMSIFQSCQKYGLQMALFFPALLLCSQWTLHAEIRWKRKTTTSFFEVDSKRGLYSHYPDTGMYIPPELLQFKERFAKLDSQWILGEDVSFLRIGKQNICIPDYTFTHIETKITVYLEIFGFWRKSALEKRINELKKHRVKLILAVSKKLMVDEKFQNIESKNVYFFYQVLNPKEIIKKLDTFKSTRRKKKE